MHILIYNVETKQKTYFSFFCINNRIITLYPIINITENKYSGARLGNAAELNYIGNTYDKKQTWKKREDALLL